MLGADSDCRRCPGRELAPPSATHGCDSRSATIPRNPRLCQGAGVLTDSDLSAWRDALLAADYRLDHVLARIGPGGSSALARNSTIPVSRALGDEASDAMLALFVLGGALPAERTSRLLGAALEPLLREGILRTQGANMRATVEVRPYGTDSGLDGWVVADFTPGLDGRLDVPAADHVLGASPASTTLAQLTTRDPVGTALDLGTGCGIQALHLAQHCDRVVATDLNPRALSLTRITAGLNGIAVEIRSGDLYAPVTDELFDLIVTNPPYVMSPPARAKLTYREAGLSGDELVHRVVAEGTARLAPGGTLQVLGNWAITDQDWVERMTGWIEPTGCDALVIERERLDPGEYIEIWLADAGLVGTAHYARRYTEWLDYFDACGIRGVGMGWLNLRNAGRRHPDVRIESWPHAVAQPVGPAIAAHFAAIGPAGLTDDQLLGARWRVADHVVQEAIGRPGAEDPEHLVLRSRSGFARAVEVDTVLAGVVGASDGDLALGQIVNALADLLGVDPAAVAGAALPRVRELIRDGFLVLA